MFVNPNFLQGMCINPLFYVSAMWSNILTMCLAMFDYVFTICDELCLLCVYHVRSYVYYVLSIELRSDELCFDRVCECAGRSSPAFMNLCVLRVKLVQKEFQPVQMVKQCLLLFDYLKNRHSI